MIISFYDKKTKTPVTSLDQLLNFDGAQVGNSYNKEFLIVNNNKFEPVTVNPTVLSYDYTKKEYIIAEKDVTIIMDKKIDGGSTAECLITFSPKSNRESALKARIFWSCEVG